MALEQANVCLLNCGPTGAEALKNLVLGGIGRCTIVDDSKVETRDLGNNFFGMFCVCVYLFLSRFMCLLGIKLFLFGCIFFPTVDWESIGLPKAKAVCAFLQELNDTVEAKFVEDSAEALLDLNPEFFSQFTLVIATQVHEGYQNSPIKAVPCPILCNNIVLHAFFLSFGLIEYNFLGGTDERRLFVEA